MCPTVVSAFVRGEHPEVELAEPERLAYNEELKAKINAIAPDAYALASFGMILPQSYLAMTPHPLCLHPGPLPKLRGPIPIRAALMEGYAETELCVMKMVREADAGPVMLRRRLPIDSQDNFASLRDKLAKLGAECIDRALGMVLDGSASYEPQVGEPSYTKLLATEDSYINFNWEARRIVNFIRGLAPEPGAACLDPWGRRIKLLRANECSLRAPDAKPGAVAYFCRHYFEVAAGNGSAICIHEVQPEGRRVMGAQEYLAGHYFTSGLRFRSIEIGNLAPGCCS